MKDSAMSVAESEESMPVEESSPADEEEEQTSPLQNMQTELHNKGAVLTKAWSDLFSFITKYQAELVVKENSVDIAEREIEQRKKQLGEMKPAVDAGNMEVYKLKDEICTKERMLKTSEAKLSVKELMLKRVESDLSCNVELLERTRSELLISRNDLVRCRGDLERSKSELTVKQEQIQIKDNLLNKLQNQLMKENSELKEQLELERRAHQLERQSHELTKRSMMSEFTHQEARKRKRTSAATSIIEIPDSPPTLDLSADIDFGLSNIVSLSTSTSLHDTEQQYHGSHDQMTSGMPSPSPSNQSPLTASRFSTAQNTSSTSVPFRVLPSMSRSWTQPTDDSQDIKPDLDSMESDSSEAGVKLHTSHSLTLNTDSTIEGPVPISGPIPSSSGMSRGGSAVVQDSDGQPCHEDRIKWKYLENTENRKAQVKIEPETGPVGEFVDQDVRPPAVIFKCGRQSMYTKEVRDKVAKYAHEFGASKATEHFSRCLGKSLNKSTIGYWRKEWIAQQKKQKLPLPVAYKHDKDHIGIHLKLGRFLDAKVQTCLKDLYESGGIINTGIVIAVAKGVISHHDPSKLIENGGKIDITRGWADCLLGRMGYVNKKHSHTSRQAMKLPVKRLEEKVQFCDKIEKCVREYKIPDALILNFDPTNIPVIPPGKYTSDNDIKERAEVSCLDDERQITGVLTVSHSGDFLPLQIIYRGKTSLCHPKYKFPNDWNITHSENSWGDLTTIDDYLEGVVLPYVGAKRESLKSPGQQALCLFAAHLSDEAVAKLHDNNISTIIIPAGFTTSLRPFCVNGSVSDVFRTEVKDSFTLWYAGKVKEAMDQGKDVSAVNAEMAVVKNIHAGWMVHAYHRTRAKVDVVQKMWAKTIITKAIERGRVHLN